MPFTRRSRGEGPSGFDASASAATGQKSTQSGRGRRVSIPGNEKISKDSKSAGNNPGRTTRGNQKQITNPSAGQKSITKQTPKDEDCLENCETQKDVMKHSHKNDEVAVASVTQVDEEKVRRSGRQRTVSSRLQGMEVILTHSRGKRSLADKASPCHSSVHKKPKSSPVSKHTIKSFDKVPTSSKCEVKHKFVENQYFDSKEKVDQGTGGKVSKIIELQVEKQDSLKKAEIVTKDIKVAQNKSPVESHHQEKEIRIFSNETKSLSVEDQSGKNVAIPERNETKNIPELSHMELPQSPVHQTMQGCDPSTASESADGRHEVNVEHGKSCHSGAKETFVNDSSGLSCMTQDIIQPNVNSDDNTGMKTPLTSELDIPSKPTTNVVPKITFISSPVISNTSESPNPKNTADFNTDNDNISADETSSSSANQAKTQVIRIVARNQLNSKTESSCNLSSILPVTDVLQDTVVEESESGNTSMSTFTSLNDTRQFSGSSLVVISDGTPAATETSFQVAGNTPSVSSPVMTVASIGSHNQSLNSVTTVNPTQQELVKLEDGTELMLLYQVNSNINNPDSQNDGNKGHVSDASISSEAGSDMSNTNTVLNAKTVDSVEYIQTSSQLTIATGMLENGQEICLPAGHAESGTNSEDMQTDLTAATNIPLVRLVSRKPTALETGITPVQTVHIKAEDGMMKLNTAVSDKTNPVQLKPSCTSKLTHELLPNMISDDMYGCPLCSYVTNKKANWYKHRKNHVGEANYICAVCSASFKTSSNLKRHILVHTNIKKFKCEECSATFRQKVQLERHITYKHRPKTLKCNFCEYTCAQFTPDLKNHMQRRHLFHTDEAKARQECLCKECGFVAVCVRDLKQHLKFHKSGPELKFYCEHCSFLTDCESRLRRHNMIHTKERPFACSMCEYRGSQKEHVLRHLKIKHQVDLSLKNSKNSEDEGGKDNMYFMDLSSEDLESGAKSVQTVVVEKELFSSEKTDSIHECSSSSNNSTYMAAEGKQVEDEATCVIQENQLMAAAPVVNKADGSEMYNSNLEADVSREIIVKESETANESEGEGAANVTMRKNKALIRSSLQQKKRVYAPVNYAQKEKLFSCMHCTMKFAKLINLYKHLRFQHSELTDCGTDGVYSCIVCEYKTSKRANLLVHMRKHNARDPLSDGGDVSAIYTCVVCNYSHSRRSALQQHMRRCHAMRVVIDETGNTNCYILNRNTEQDRASQVLQHVAAEDSSLVLEGDVSVTEVAHTTGDVNIDQSYLTVSQAPNIEHLEQSEEHSRQISQVQVSGPDGSLQTVVVEMEPGKQVVPPIPMLDVSAVDAIQGLQALAEQVAEKDQGGSLNKEGDKSDTDTRRKSVEGGDNTGQGVEISQEELMELSSGDIIEINGEMYKVEFSTDETTE